MMQLRNRGLWVMNIVSERKGLAGDSIRAVAEVQILVGWMQAARFSNMARIMVVSGPESFFSSR
jgi:hypothetical protein